MEAQRLRLHSQKEKQMKNKILIIEDDKIISHFLQVALETNGYTTISAKCGLDGINSFINGSFDLVVLDMGLPDIDGQLVLKQIVDTGKNIPIIIVTAREKEEDKVSALDSGAVDYITKPFNINELLARVRVALRQKTQVEENDSFDYKGIHINLKNRKVQINDHLVHFTPIEYNILLLFIDNRGKVLTHKYLQNQIWGYDTLDDYQALRVFIASIRKKISQYDEDNAYINTEVGVGYWFSDD